MRVDRLTDDYATPRAILVRAAQAIASENAFTRRFAAEDRLGNRSPMSGHSPVKWSIGGALQNAIHAFPKIRSQEMRCAEKTLVAVIGADFDEWGRDPAVTFDAVRAAMMRAVEAAPDELVTGN